MSILNWFDNLAKQSKNLVVKTAVQRYFHKYIDRILECSLDPQRQELHLVVEFKGEEKPMIIDVAYELSFTEQDSIVQVKAHNISISKEWLNLVAQEVIDREFTIREKDMVRALKWVRKLGIG